MTGGSRTTYAALALVLLAAFLLRYRAVEFGFPLLVHPDEPQIAVPAAQIAATGDLDPNTFLYPSLFIYMQSAVFAAVFGVGRLAGAYERFSDVPLTTLYLWGRLLTVLVSLATIGLAFVMAGRLAGSVAGLVAALLTACSFLHFSNSYTITTDSPMAFWVMLSMLGSLAIVLDGPATSRYLLAGIAAGLAGGTKYNAVFAVVPIVVAHLIVRFRSGQRWRATKLAGDAEAAGAARPTGDPEPAGDGQRPRDTRLLAALAAVAAAFVCSTPYALVKPSMFLDFLEVQRIAYGLGHPGAEGASLSYTFYLDALITKFGALPMLLALVGVVHLWRAGRGKCAAAVVLSSFVLTYFGFMGAYRVRFDRNAVVFIPFAAVLAGIGFRALLVMLRSPRMGTDQHVAARWWPIARRILLAGPPRVLLAVLLAAVLVWSLYRQSSMSLAYAREITLPDTRWIAKTWIEENMPQGSKIAVEFYTPPLDPNLFQVTELGYYGLIRTAGLDRFDYLVASSQDFGRFVRHPDAYPTEARRYKEIFARYRLIKLVRPEQGRSGGPSIFVYATH